MVDRYIDAEETQIYGAYTSRMIRSHVLPLLPVAGTFLQHIASELDDATEAMGVALERARVSSAGIRVHAASKNDLVAEVNQYLVRFGKHLDTHTDKIDRRTFFPQTGNASGIGKSGPRVLFALSHIVNELKREAPLFQIREQEVWLREAEALLAVLTPALTQAQSAQATRRSVTPELEAARQAWLATYQATKSIVEGILRLQGRLSLLNVIFHDLAVSDNTKITQIPTPPVDTPANTPVNTPADPPVGEPA